MKKIYFLANSDSNFLHFRQTLLKAYSKETLERNFKLNLNYLELVVASSRARFLNITALDSWRNKMLKCSIHVGGLV